MKHPTVNFMLLWDYSCSHRWERGSHWGSLFVLHFSAFVCRLLLQQQQKKNSIFLFKHHQKLTLCKRSAAACETAVRSFGWGKSVCAAAAAVVPPGFKRSDGSVTNESLLHGSFPFAGGTIWRTTLLRANGDVSSWMEKILQSQSDKSWLWSRLLPSCTQ